MPTAIFGRLCGALLLALLLNAPSAASDRAQPMRFDRLTLDDGLSQSAVVSVLQDSNGYMWFGTESGLNRFDGYEMTRFTQDRGNPNAILSDFIYDLDEDSKGNLWIATNGGGLARYDHVTESFASYRHDPANPASLSSEVVRTVLVDQQDRVWVGMRGAGLDRYDAESGTFIHYPLGDSDEQSVFALFMDATDTLWVGTDAGLFAVDAFSGETREFRAEATDGSLSSDRIRSILADSSGRLWVGTYDGGLNRYDAASNSFIHYALDKSDAASLSSNRVTSIFEDADARIWVGTMDGLNLYDEVNDGFHHFVSDPSDLASLSSNAVSDIFQDQSGLMWFGTLTNGVSKWNPRSWALGLQDSGSIAATEDAQPVVTSFATDARNRVWIGTFGEGLLARNRSTGEIQRFRHDPAAANSLSDDRVMSLAIDREGLVWAGTMRGGLSVLDPDSGEFTVYRHDAEDPASLSADGVMSIFEDSRGEIWVGTFGGGVSLFDRASGTFSTIRDGLDSTRITTIAEDQNGNVWIGTDAGGLSLYNRASEELTTFRYDRGDAYSLSADTIYSLHVDADGTVWVGTRGAGLDRVVGNSDEPESIRFANLSSRDGLSNNVIYGVQSTAAGELWLSTNYGITRLNPKTKDVRVLHRRHGLQSEEFNFGAHHAAADGTLYFGGPAGFNEFEPEGLPVSKAIPPVMLTGFYKFGDSAESDLPANLSDGIELDHNETNLSFEFAALDFVSSEANRYMYKLEGFDKRWIDLGTQRRVTYKNLDDGQYLLRVKAANADGVWNEAAFAMPISVKPAPWDTWWAYMIYGGLLAQLGVALWWMHKRRLHREAMYSKRLEREVEQRTQELARRSEELIELNQSLQESSLSDPLTGLRNRRFVFEEISRDLETIGRKHADERLGMNTSSNADLVFMMIDLDNFKPINDTYGHAAGDQVLLEIRDVLLATCRRSDFVVRWGGDEFVVVAKQSRDGEAEALAERIRSKIASTSFVLEEGQTVRTTCSIGFVAYPLYSGHSESAGLDEVIHLADSLMYEAKSQRNAWVGLLGVDEAATSADFETGEIAPSSVLFRARRNGNLIKHQPDHVTTIVGAEGVA